MRPSGDLSGRRDAAVAEPARLAVGAGAVQHNVGLLDALLPLTPTPLPRGERGEGSAHEKTKRMFTARGAAGILFLQHTLSADGDDACLEAQLAPQRRCVGQWFEIGGDVFAPREQGVVGRQVAAGVIGLDVRTAQRRAVHAERAEHLDVAPVAQMLANAAGVEHGDRQPERRGIEGRLQPDGAGAENGDAQRVGPCHVRPSVCFPRLAATR